MCRYCREQLYPVRVSSDSLDDDEGPVIGQVNGVNVVDNIGTVYMALYDGRQIQATVPHWYGETEEPTEDPT